MTSPKDMSSSFPSLSSSILELELSYLAAEIPKGLLACKHELIEDMYFPARAEHALLRIRHQGDVYEVTKKVQSDPDDASAKYESNISLSAEEFAALAKGDGVTLTKTRFYYPYNDLVAEVDVFSESLQGLVLIEFEFDSQKKKDSFAMPNFCLRDVTQEAFLAGGMLPGKSYKGIESNLRRFKYKPLFLEKH